MSQEKIDTISINNVEYVRKDQISNSKEAEKLDGLRYVIIRTQSAGVFAGYLKSRVGQEVVIINARRLYYWSGAATLSQAATEGFSKPKECKFPCEVANLELTQAIEILDCTEKARLSIKSIAIWRA